VGRVGVFVDAGYLFAQGSTVLTGSKKPRLACSLDEAAVIDQLRRAAQDCAVTGQLLRIYWYDGLMPRGLSQQQEAMASLQDVKLRLGFVNTQGEQKGVDSLIVTDLVELARNRAMSDAVVMSGDEDIRVGVQIAQSYGVRVHLLGITPARGSQSKQLLHEADTTAEWSRAVVETFLKVIDLPETPEQSVRTEVLHALNLESSPSGFTAAHRLPVEVEDCAKDFVAVLSAEQRAELVLHCAANSSIPAAFDRQLLSRAGRQLGRWLDEPEKRLLRAAVVLLLRQPPA
jgi:uncharacterized LabA/DUF88 family protein